MELGAPAVQPLSWAEIKPHGSISASFGASSNDSVLLELVFSPCQPASGR